MICGASQCGVSQTSVELPPRNDPVGIRAAAVHKTHHINTLHLVESQSKVCRLTAPHSEISPAARALMQLFSFHFHSVATFFTRLVKWPL